jgi:hypothetical protein
VEDKPTQRTVRLREKTKVVFKGRSDAQKKDTPKITELHHQNQPKS